MEDHQTQQEQASPEIVARIRESFDRQGLMAHLGAQLVANGQQTLIRVDPSER
ncbi:hypothetical protein AB0C95_33225 [Streptomyces caniferus]|uniref:hypothetical protein n=1 Tax=Streptomyces caniferus TaxID=285557 RepID=UPI0033C0F08D